MNPAPPPDDIPESTNRTSDSTTTAPNLSAASAPQPPKPSSPSWSSQTPAFSAAVPKPGATPPVFPQFSASTAEILKRLQANSTHASGTPAFEAKRAELLQNYVTSDKLPTPPPIANAGRRGGRGGGRGGAPSALKTAVGAATTTPGSGATPTSARGSGRGRGRGRGGGRGGKRKRAESVDSDVSIQTQGRTCGNGSLTLTCAGGRLGYLLIIYAAPHKDKVRSQCEQAGLIRTDATGTNTNRQTSEVHENDSSSAMQDMSPRD